MIAECSSSARVSGAYSADSRAGRRSSLLMIGAVLLTAALPVGAQSTGKTRLIGWFGNTPPIPETAFLGDAFREGLKERGYVEGVNVTSEYRFGEGNVARYPALAAELAALGADVVAITAGPPGPLAVTELINWNGCTGNMHASRYRRSPVRQAPEDTGSAQPMMACCNEPWLIC